MAYKAQPIVLDEATRKVLEARVRATTTPQRDVSRGRSSCWPPTAWRLARSPPGGDARVPRRDVAPRFLAEGLDGLGDAPRPGRPPIYAAADRLVQGGGSGRLVPRDPDDPEATWTYQGLADELADDVGISRSQLWRILDGLDIKPTR